MHHRPPERPAHRIVPRQPETTLEADDGIVRTGRARGVRRSGSAPLVGARARALSNTAVQTGTALGVAIVTTVAVSHSQQYLAAHTGANPLAALAEGYQSAFLARAVLAGIGLALAFLLPGRPRKPAHELPEPDPAADAAAAGDVVIRSGTK
jgi:hypothetical protein